MREIERGNELERMRQREIDRETENETERERMKEREGENVAERERKREREREGNHLSMTFSHQGSFAGLLFIFIIDIELLVVSQ